MAGPCLLTLHLSWAWLPYHICLCWKIMCSDRNNGLKTGVDKTQRWDGSSVIIQANCFPSYIRKLSPKKFNWPLKGCTASERAKTKTNTIVSFFHNMYLLVLLWLFLKLHYLHDAMGQIFLYHLCFLNKGPLTARLRSGLSLPDTIYSKKAHTILSNYPYAFCQ